MISNHTSMYIMDSHVHLSDYEYQYYIKNIINNMEFMDLYACSVSVNLESSIRNLNLFKDIDIIKVFVGIHPQFSNQNQIYNIKDILSENSKHISGIGEIGLDPKYFNLYNTPSLQKKTFIYQLQLAEKYDKPISIHSRKTVDEILSILQSYNIKKILFHWFEGNNTQLKKVMDKGYYISIGPSLLYSRDKKKLLKEAERDFILVETDGPLKYPYCFENKPSNPSSLIVSIAKCVADTLRIPFQEIIQQLKRNSSEYLG